MSEEELDGIPHKDWVRYVQAIRVIRAQKSLDEIRTTNFSHYKKESRRKIIKNYKKMAYGYFEKKKVSLQDAFKILGKKLNGRKT